MATTKNLLSLLADVVIWVLLGKYILRGKKKNLPVEHTIIRTFIL